MIQGVTRPDPRELDQDGPLSRTVRVETLGPQYEACNIFYPRELLEALGGFDERFGALPAGEDTDLAWRAIERGARPRSRPTRSCSTAVDRVGIARHAAVRGRWGAVARLFSAHPQTRAMLHRHVFWNVWHYLLWRSVLSLAGATAGCGG